MQISREVTRHLFSLCSEPGINQRLAFLRTGACERNLFSMKCVPVHHGIQAALHRDVPWLHGHSENGALACECYKLLFGPSAR